MKLHYNNDINLIYDLKKGESRAYTFLVNTYHHKLCIYASNLTNNSDLAEDIVQNVFMNIWKQKHNLKDDLAIKSYLYKSVYNEFINQYRKQKKVLPIEKKHFEAISNIIEEEDEVSLQKLITIVKSEIENLPPKCKQSFLLSKQDGLTNIEIAEYLDISIKTVEAHITKAFFILQKKVGTKTNSILFLLFGFTKKESFNENGEKKNLIER